MFAPSDFAVATALEILARHGIDAALLVPTPEAFWVRPRCRKRGSLKEFHYVEVQYTGGPVVANFPALVEAGEITADYALRFDRSRARDHGFLFKIHPRDMGALFPPPEVHALS